MYAGPVEAGERALREVRTFGPPAADFFEPTAYADFQCSLDDPPGYRNYWTAEHIADLSDEAVAVIARRSEQIPASPSQLFIVPWGGQVARVGPESSPVAGRQAAFIVHPLLLWDDPAHDTRMLELGRAFGEDLRPFSTGATTSTSSATKAANGSAPGSAPATSGSSRSRRHGTPTTSSEAISSYGRSRLPDPHPKKER